MMNDTEHRDGALATNRFAGRSLYPWYDSGWLAKYVKAQGVIKRVRPAALSSFIDALRVFRTSQDFNVQLLEQPFDDSTLHELRQAARSLRPTDLEFHEARAFGRFVVHNHPFFNEVQQRTVALVSDVVGEPVEMSYNFLSLYGAQGVCAPHMDAPEAKWTLDLCLDQNAPWPIYLSQVCAWPESPGEAWANDGWEHDIKHAPAVHFSAYTLQPGQALVFSGSSQWHYRDTIPAAAGRQFCDLLFFHFIPKGTAALVRPGEWARLFGIPELSEIV